MSSMNTLINKLLKALEYEQGIIYCLDRKQYYSETLKRKCTKYILHRTYENKDGDKIKENHQFNKQLDLLLFLVDRVKKGGVEA